MRRATRGEKLVTLDGKQLPLGDDRAMNAFRFKSVSIVPQYAMSALNPTRKVGRIAFPSLLLILSGSTWM